MKHEKDAIKMVTQARERMLGAGTMKERAKAEGHFKLLQEQLEGIENKIAYSRQFYNDSVLSFNNMISTIPGTWFAGMVGRKKTREYFEIPGAERKPVKVEF